eukprot:TRINITY_DN7829_c0_g1_i15.p1 TRINITY_DN7829_c0_g1~~TRINITY_DN7829_c0_g1_i15.p1  ORF type:complete len:312 (+),score=58.08 TRINITY_DN7829_c0_g1_i15:787-1722(+)
MQVILLFVTFLSLGNELLFITGWIGSEVKSVGEYSRSMMLTLPPATISLVQLVLSLAVFKRDTPIKLTTDAMHEELADELRKIYPSERRRKSEIEMLKNMDMINKHKAPSYKELFTGRNLKLLFKGILIATFTNCTGTFSRLFFMKYAFMESDKNIMSLSSAIGNLVITLGTLFPLFSYKSTFSIILVIKQKSLLFFGSIGIILSLLGSLISFLVYDSLSVFNVPDVIFSFIGFLVYGMTVYPLCFRYIIDLLPERGFTVLISWYWFVFVAINLTFYIFIGIRADFDNYHVNLCYLLAFFVISLFVLCNNR